MSVNSGLKATKIKGQRKAFYRQRIPEFTCARKETVRNSKEKKTQGELIKKVAEETTDKKAMQKLHAIGVFSWLNVKFYS